MMNKSEMNKEKVTALLSVVGKKLGVAPEELQRQLEQGRYDSMLSSLKAEEAQKLRQALSNPKLAEQLMNVPQAKALYERLNGK